MNKLAEVSLIVGFIFGPAVIGTVLWLYTGGHGWLAGWAWTIIILLAG